MAIEDRGGLYGESRLCPLSDSSPQRVRHRKRERNKNRACVRYRADLLLLIRIMPKGWPRFSIAALTSAKTGESAICDLTPRARRGVSHFG